MLVSVRQIVVRHEKLENVRNSVRAERSVQSDELEEDKHKNGAQAMSRYSPRHNSEDSKQNKVRITQHD